MAIAPRRIIPTAVWETKYESIIDREGYKLEFIWSSYSGVVRYDFILQIICDDLFAILLREDNSWRGAS